jgi:hypothetical protein
MQDIDKIKNNASKGSEELLEYISTSHEPQNLERLYSNLYKESPAAHEVMLLIHQELITNSKMDKKKIGKILGAAISTDNITADKLKEHTVKIGTIEDQLDKDIYKKIMSFITMKNVYKLLGAWTIIVIVLFTMYTINPIAYDKVMNTINSGWSQTTDTLKEKTHETISSNN